MEAVVYTAYGSPKTLEVKEVETPVPTDDEILIKVHAVSVNRSDWEGLVTWASPSPGEKSLSP